MTQIRSMKIFGTLLILAVSSILNPAISQDTGQKSEAPPTAKAVSGQGTANPRDPVLNFEYVWNRLDRNYGQFEAKHVDWDALYRTYRPQVTSPNDGSGAVGHPPRHAGSPQRQSMCAWRTTPAGRVAG